MELLHDNAGQHMRLKELRERRKSLFINGPYSRPMLARQEIAIRWVGYNMGSTHIQFAAIAISDSKCNVQYLAPVLKFHVFIGVNYVVCRMKIFVKYH